MIQACHPKSSSLFSSHILKPVWAALAGVTQGDAYSPTPIMAGTVITRGRFEDAFTATSSYGFFKYEPSWPGKGLRLWWEHPYFRQCYDKKFLWSLLTQPVASFKWEIGRLLSVDRRKLKVFIRSDFKTQLWMAFPGIGERPDGIDPAHAVNAIQNIAWVLDHLAEQGYSPRKNYSIEEGKHASVCDGLARFVASCLEPDVDKYWFEDFSSLWPRDLSYGLYRHLKDEPKQMRTLLEAAERTDTLSDLVRRVPDLTELNFLVRNLIYFQFHRLPELDAIIVERAAELEGNRDEALEPLHVALRRAEPNWQSLDETRPHDVLVAMLSLFRRRPDRIFDIIRERIGGECFLSWFGGSNMERIVGAPSKFRNLKGIPYEMLPPHHLVSLARGLLIVADAVERYSERQLVPSNSQFMDCSRMVGRLFDIIEDRFIDGSILNNNAKACWVVERESREFLFGLTAEEFCLLSKHRHVAALRLLNMSIERPGLAVGFELDAWISYLKTIVVNGKLHEFVESFKPLGFSPLADVEYQKVMMYRDSILNHMTPILVHIGPVVLELLRSEPQGVPHRYIEQFEDYIQTAHEILENGIEMPDRNGNPDTSLKRYHFSGEQGATG